MFDVFKQFTKRSFSVNQIILLLAGYYTLVLNWPFVSGITSAIVNLSHFNVLFLASVPVLLFSLLVLVFSLFSVRYIFKPAIIIITIISALVFYAGISYGVVFDYGMIQNVFETNSAEASTYLNWYAVVFFLITGALPSYLLYRAQINYQPFVKETLSRLKLVLIILLGIIVIAWGFYSNYASVMRNNSHLKRFIVPTQFLSSGYKYIRDHYFSSPREFKILDAHPTLKPHVSNNKNKVVVLVVGETARAANFSYQGYERDTNEFTEPYQVTYFKQVSSCGTATAVSVPCMFSHQVRDNFDRQDALSEQNLLDLAKQAGVDVLWIDNNSGCQNVCERVNTVRIDTSSDNPLCDGKYCFDEILLPNVESKLKHITAQTTFIVLHVIGSHGPTYYLRYPEKFKHYTPDCPQSDIQNCTQAQLVNTYDNTLHYTDFVLSQLMQQFSAKPELDVSMMYISDHGESLGESGAYLHGFPYSLAPEVQKHVPMWLWSNQANNIEQSACIRAKTEQAFSHDNVFHTMLGVIGVETSVYEPSKDIMASCR